MLPNTGPIVDAVHGRRRAASEEAVKSTAFARRTWSGVHSLGGCNVIYDDGRPKIYRRIWRLHEFYAKCRSRLIITMMFYYVRLLIHK